MKKKRVFCAILCALILTAISPAALAARPADGMTAAQYALRVDDDGVWDILVEYVGPGVDPIVKVQEIPGGGPKIDLEQFINNMIYGDLVQPGCEKSITFRLQYGNLINFPSSTNGFKVYFGTEQIGGQANLKGGGVYYVAVPLDEGEDESAVVGPRDDRGNVDIQGLSIGVTVPRGAESVFDMSIPQHGWDGPAMLDMYKKYPANVMDKFQFSSYVEIVPENDPTSFRDAAGDPVRPSDLGTPKRASWMTVEDAQAYEYGTVESGEAMYIHYTFYWDGSNYSKTVKESLVSPVINDNGSGVLVGTPRGGGDVTIHDNYYMAARALFKFELTVTPQGEEKPPTPNPTPNPNPRPTSPTVAPTGEPVDDPTPPVVDPPTDGPTPAKTPPGGDETVDTGKTPTDMPRTGGFSLFNLFFVGLFLFGVGLIYLKSRKTEEGK